MPGFIVNYYLGFDVLQMILEEKNDVVLAI